MLLLLLTTLLLADLAVCSHPSAIGSHEKAPVYNNLLPPPQGPAQPQYQPQPQPQPVGPDQCANGFPVSSSGSAYVGSPGSGSAYTGSGSGSAYVGRTSSGSAYLGDLPAPILNSYVDSRFVNVLPQANLVNVAGFGGPLTQYPPLQNPPLQNPPLQNPIGSNQLDPASRTVGGFAGGLYGSPPLPPPVTSDAFANAIPPGQERRYIRPGLEVAFNWRFVDWVRPNAQLTGKNFTLGDPLIQDVDIDRRGRVFVSTPWWLPGVPITLSTLTELKGPGGPLLTPYPDWRWHQLGCDSLHSVFRVAIDECDRLWTLDSGSAFCPSKFVVFDLRTDKPLHSYTIPKEQTAGGRASYVNPVVEVGDSCNDTYLYVADVIAHGLLVYSLRENRSWRLDNTPSNAFGNDPGAGSIIIAGEEITLTDGTLGLALSPRGFFNKRYLYFNSLASFYQKFADSDSLKRSFIYEPIMYQSVDRRISHAGVHAMSRTGALFFQLAQYTALACWNIERPFTPDNVVVLARDEVTLQYISGIKVVTNVFGEEELWFNTNRLQKTINKSRRIEEINYRLIRGKVDDLIRGTKCEPTGFKRAEPNLLGWKRI